MKILAIVMMMGMLITPVQEKEVEPQKPANINEAIEYVNTEFAYYYLCPERVITEDTVLQYDYCIGLAQDGYIDAAYEECLHYTNITDEIREEFQVYVEEAFIECEELVDKTAILHFIFQ